MPLTILLYPLRNILLLLFGNTDNRLYICRMEATNKRKARSYKVYDKVYFKALKRGQKEKKPLAQLLEKVVALYADGHTLAAFQGDTARAFKIE